MKIDEEEEDDDDDEDESNRGFLSLGVFPSERNWRSHAKFLGMPDFYGMPVAREERGGMFR